jgi:hypothetical protein
MTLLAAQKLNRYITSSGLSNRSELSKEGMIAVLCVRVCFDVAGYAPLASKLVADSMAICYAVSSDRNGTVMGYPVEPMIGAGSMYWMVQSGSVMTECVKELLRAVFHMRVVERGVRGELLSRLITVSGYDTCLRQSGKVDHLKAFLVSVRLEEYLSTTYSANFVACLFSSCETKGRDPERLKNCKELLNGSVRICKYIRIAGKLDLSLAHMYYCFGVAIWLRAGQVGLDSAIPVRLAKDKYSWIFIQDRNYADADKNMKDAWQVCAMSKVFDNWPKAPYLVIYHQYGESSGHFGEPVDLFRYRGVKRLTARQQSGGGAPCVDGKAEAEDEYMFIVGVSGLCEANFQHVKSVPNLLESYKQLRDGYVAVPDMQDYAKFWNVLEFGKDILFASR